MKERKMKTKMPAGQFCATLEHHPNQREGTFIATITDGEHKGKSFLIQWFMDFAEEDNG